MKRRLVVVVWIMLFSYLCSYVFASMKNASSFNSFLYDYGIKNMPRQFHTGKLYDVDLPFNFSGVEVSIIRLRTSRLWRNGLNYSSFEIPSEMLPMPFTRRVDVVYQSLGNWSNAYYRLPDVGVAQDEDGSLKCVRFMTNGSWELSNLTSKSTCVATALVVKCLKRRKVWLMERESERSVILDTIWIGNSKLPFASGIRTEPDIEDHNMDIESSSNIIPISKAVLQVSMMSLVF